MKELSWIVIFCHSQISGIVTFLFLVRNGPNVLFQKCRVKKHLDHIRQKFRILQTLCAATVVAWTRQENRLTRGAGQWLRWRQRNAADTGTSPLHADRYSVRVHLVHPNKMRILDSAAYDLSGFCEIGRAYSKRQAAEATTNHYATHPKQQQHSRTARERT